MENWMMSLSHALSNAFVEEVEGRGGNYEMRNEEGMADLRRVGSKKSDPSRLIEVCVFVHHTPTQVAGCAE
jgi:hypothetical protein